MGWVLGCFKCSGDPHRVKPKKQSSGVVNLVSGRANSAAVAHATSPEDLQRVRKSPSILAVNNSNSNNERGCLEFSSSSFPSVQSQSKTNEFAKLGSKLNEAKKFSNRERTFRERRVKEVDAVRQLSDEVKDSQNCHGVLRPPPNSFKVTNKLEKDINVQDFTQHSWLVSSLVTRSGILFEATSRPNSPFSGIQEHGSLHNRGIQTCQNSDSYDKFVDVNIFRAQSGDSDEFIDVNDETLQAIYCKVEHKTKPPLSDHDVQSPPWTFSEAKLDVGNHKNLSIFESSEDLLLEHLDVSSLIEDSALITNWELSSGELHSEKWALHDQLSHAPSHEEGKLLHVSGQTKQTPIENGAEDDTVDSDSSCSMAIFEGPSDDGKRLCAHPSLGEGHYSLNGLLNLAQAPHDASGDKESIYAVSNVDYNVNAQLLQADCCSDIEGIDFNSDSQSFFPSEFKQSKCLCSSARTNPPERDSSMAGYIHDKDNDVDELLLLYTHPEMQLLQKSKNFNDEDQRFLNAATESSETSTDIQGSYKERSGVHVGNLLQSSTCSFLKPLVQQDSVEASAFEDEMVALKEGDLLVASFSTEEERREQQKKLSVGHGISFERLQDTMLLVEDEQAAFGHCHERSLEPQVDISNGLEGSAPEQVFDQSHSEETSDPTLAFPSSSHVQVPMASSQSPARLADDRPILGTVAAHWSPIRTKKWWDGKGIPNSTNKYKEDQKVNWHAIPFEVRLEQALAKQESVPAK